MFRRTKGKRNTDFKAKDLYKFFKAKYKIKLSYDMYRLLCKEFNEFIVNDMIYNAADVYLPAGLGCIGIRRFKSDPYIDENGKVRLDHIPIDYKATKKLWVEKPETYEKKTVVRLLNQHTNGYKYRFYWDKSTIHVTNGTIYKFYASRDNKRNKLVKAIKGESTLKVCETPTRQWSVQKQSQ